MSAIQNTKTERSTAQGKSKKIVAFKKVTTVDKGILCRLHCERIYKPANLSALSEVFAKLKYPSILGANPSITNAGRFSYWAAEPKEIFEFQEGQKDPFEKLHSVLNKYKIMDSRWSLPRTTLRGGNDRGNGIEDLPKGIFRCGWVGYFSYELARYIERLPQTTLDDLQMPLIRLCFYDRVIVFDHLGKTFWLLALEIPGDTKPPGQKLAELEMLLEHSQKIKVHPPAPSEPDGEDLPTARCNMSKDYYIQALAKIKKYIYDGEVYQINFSRRPECEYDAEPIELFHWQNFYNPSPYSAYIDAGNFHIVSASPEMFITIADGTISTKPIKGTRPRINKAGADATNYNELVSSEKEQAELNMIIDLERNDIAKICVPGTRQVTQPRTIETYPTVFHAVATIAGQLRNEVNFCDILKAVFPGGSITGAPKIRSMEIIDQLEPTARGVYTGSIGYIGLDGSACLNIAIRTIIIKNHKAYAQTGGGIVADSDAEAEWQETIIKAKALLAGINSVQRSKNGKDFSKRQIDR